MPLQPAVMCRILPKGLPRNMKNPPDLKVTHCVLSSGGRGGFHGAASFFTGAVCGLNGRVALDSCLAVARKEEMETEAAPSSLSLSNSMSWLWGLSCLLALEGRPGDGPGGGPGGAVGGGGGGGADNTACSAGAPGMKVGEGPVKKRA